MTRVAALALAALSLAACGNTVGDRALSGGREQVGLGVIEEGLNHEQANQAEGDAVEKLAAALLEGSVQQEADDAGKGETDGAAAEKGGGGPEEAGAVGSYPGPEPVEPAW